MSARAVRRAALRLLAMTVPLAGCAPPPATGAEQPASAPPVTSPPAPSRLLWCPGPSGRLRVTDGGNGGIPVIFVHGLAGSHAHWSAQLDHLRRTRRAAALDLHGFGESEPSPEGAYSIETFVGDVVAAADALDVRRFVLVGHSMGSTIAIACADKHPERVAGLLLVDPSRSLNRLPGDVLVRLQKNLEPETYEMFMDSWFGAMLGSSRSSVRASVVSTLRATTRDVVATSLSSLYGYDPVPPLARYAGPKLAILPPSEDEAQSLHLLVPGLPVQRMEGVGHWPMMDEPDDFNQRMDDFIAKVPGEARASPRGAP